VVVLSEEEAVVHIQDTLHGPGVGEDWCTLRELEEGQDWCTLRILDYTPERECECEPDDAKLGDASRSLKEWGRTRCWLGWG